MISFIFMFLSCLSKFISNPLDSTTFCKQIIQQKGEQLFQSGKYQKAYRLFVGLQELQHRQWSGKCYWRQHQRQHQLAVYYQCRCLIHLAKHQQALNICHVMIKAHPSMIWYQLAADIYIQDGRLDLALDTVSSSRWLYGHDDWDEINLQERILYEGHLHQQKQHTPARLNMVDVLAYDTVCSIFMLLPLKSLVVCSRVNRAWRSIILTNPLFWQNLDFYGNHRRPPPTTTIQLYLSRLDGVPLHSILIHNQRIAQTILKCNCSQLYELDWASFQCTPKEDYSLLRQVIYATGKTLTKLRLGSGWFKLSDVFDLVVTCPHLTRLDVYDCFTSQPPYNSHDVIQDTIGTTSLRYLGLSDVRGLTTLHLSSLLQRCPHLMELTLDNCMDNIHTILNVLHPFCPKLDRFFYRPSHSTPFPLPDTLPVLPHGCQAAGHADWTQFTLKQTRALTDDLLHSVLAGSYHNIQTLDLEGNQRLTDHCIFNMGSLQHLEECSFANCTNITEAGLCVLLTQAPGLRRLDLSGLSSVTDVVLQLMTLACPHLAVLRLARCRSMTEKGILCFIDSFCRDDDNHRGLQELDLTDTDLSMECLAYAMCRIQQHGI